MEEVHRRSIRNFPKGSRYSAYVEPEVPSGSQGQSHGRVEAEARTEISGQFLTFSCSKFTIQ